MDAIAIIFTAIVMGTIVLSPFFGAESRPDFLRPDRRHGKMLSPFRLTDLGR
jgi:hypothetical protein